MRARHPIRRTPLPTGWPVSVLLAVGAGLLAAWLTPRGPITTAQALVSMGAAVAIGALAGAASGRRWAILVVPLIFLLAFETGRMGVDGPTVDQVFLGSTYGVIAFVVGRLLHGVLVLAPLTVGTALGVGLGWRIHGGAVRPLGAAGWTMIVLATLALVALAVAIAQPARTAAIVGPEGQPLPGSIAELTRVRIGGHDQALMIRGRSVTNPLLLYLAGGPGGTDLGAMRADVGLEQDFLVVTWEQRGAGQSYAALDPASTLTLEQTVADTIELSEWLLDRFEQDELYLVGNSWGTLLGALAAQRRPDLFRAFVGTGQMVSPRETDVLFYDDTLAWAERTGQLRLADRLRAQGPPPYGDLLAYEPTLTFEHEWNPNPLRDPATEMPANLFVPENAFMDRMNGLRSFLDTFSVLYPQLQELDLRTDVPALEVPYVMVTGRYEARGRREPADDWFEALEAPSKARIVFDASGHRPSFQEPAAFAALMRRLRDGEPLVLGANSPR